MRQKAMAGEMVKGEGHDSRLFVYSAERRCATSQATRRHNHSTTWFP